jgi:hypothetical protein
LTQLNVERFADRQVEPMIGSNVTTGLNGGAPKGVGELGVRRTAFEALKAAFARVRDNVEASGWLVIQEPVEHAADHLIVRFAIRSAGVVVSTCGFALGPGPALVFGRPGDDAVIGDLDVMGEVDFQRLIETWVSETRAGVGHRWQYEAKMGRNGQQTRPQISR